jgi:hypothetical protein
LSLHAANPGADQYFELLQNPFRSGFEKPEGDHSSLTGIHLEREGLSRDDIGVPFDWV